MLGAFSDNTNPDYRLQKFVALVCITFICLIHLFSRKMGIYVNNTLALYKVTLLVFVVLAGFVCLGGGGGKRIENGDTYGAKNLEDAFSNSSKSPYDYANAMLHILYSYQGWENANYVGKHQALRFTMNMGNIDARIGACRSKTTSRRPIKDI